MCSTPATLIDRLVDMSLVTRDADPSDRRAIRLALTVEGRQVLERHERLLAGRVREVLLQDGEATQEELAGVRAACRVLSRAMDARKERVYREAAAPQE